MPTTPTPTGPLCSDVPAILERACADLFTRAARGETTALEASGLVSGAAVLPLLPTELQRLFEREPKQLTWMLRLLYTRQVSWAVYHTAWFDSCAELIHRIVQASRPSDDGASGPLVLEVCAGAGLLRDPMQKRGLRWLATDVKPRPATPTEACGALEALERTPRPDVVFWSWWSHDKRGDALDAQAAARCAERGIPIVFVGEGEGGCTGSPRLWQGPWRIEPAASAAQAFSDVLSWEGFRDRTYVILPPAGREEAE